MPVIGFEARTVPKIASEFDKLATTLRSWPKGSSASSRGAGPSRTILSSLKKVNRELSASARKGSVSAASFRAMGRDFARLGTALGRAAATTRAAKTTRRTKKARTTRKRAARKT